MGSSVGSNVGMPVGLAVLVGSDDGVYVGSEVGS